MDHVLIGRRWASSILDCKTWWGVSVGGDHGLVLAKLRVRLKVGKQVKAKNMGFCVNEAGVEMFRREVAGGLMEACTGGVENRWLRGKEKVLEAARRWFGAVRKLRKPWISWRTVELADERCRMAAVGGVSSSMNRAVRQSAARDREEYWENLAENVERGGRIGDWKAAFGAVRRMRSKGVVAGLLKGEDGIVRGEKESSKIWKEYFEGLLNGIPTSGGGVDNHGGMD